MYRRQDDFADMPTGGAGDWARVWDAETGRAFLSVQIQSECQWNAACREAGNTAACDASARLRALTPFESRPGLVSAVAGGCSTSPTNLFSPQ